MIHDVKSVIHNGKSYWGLGALVTIGIDTLSKFRYGYSEKPDIERNSFQKFLEVYISPKFKKTIKTPFRKPNLKGLGSWFYKPSNLKYSEIFFFGFRNYLVHRFCFRYNFLIDPQDHFLRWKPQKLILSIDARRLLVNFEDGVRKYMRVMEKSNVGNEIYDNFFKMFSGTFEVY